MCGSSSLTLFDIDAAKKVELNGFSFFVRENPSWRPIVVYSLLAYRRPIPNKTPQDVAVFGHPVSEQRPP